MAASKRSNLQLKREDRSLFGTVEGLTQRGANDKLRRLVVKPLADNALDKSTNVRVDPILGLKQPHNDLKDREPPHSHSRSNGQAPQPEEDPAKPGSLSDAEFDAEIQRLAALNGQRYERHRGAAAKRLGLGVGRVDKLVNAERKNSAEDSKQGRPLSLPEPEPWPEPVNGAELLDALAASIRRHVVMPDLRADIAGLWVLHTYLLDCFGISPRLAITSPEKGCGKTTLLDVLSRLVMRPLPTANVTVSAIFRVVEVKQPTLLIDEADSFLSGNEELRGILNSGHRQGGSVIRSVGENCEPRAFSTYSACAIALIGQLPTTLTDRSVPIELRRRRPDETCEPFRFNRTGLLDQLARQAARWATDNADRVRGADPDMPCGMVNRLADNWRPLIAIADVAGGEWPFRARQAAQALAAAAGDNDQFVRIALLTDVRAIFAGRGTARLASAVLLEALVAIEGRPWAEWKAGNAITANGLARLLAPLEIKPATIRTSNGTPKGYQLAQFKEAFARYLPGEEL
jgi:putative DNA primase/helicase